jgi:uncharacterized protein (TIGR02271 family)
MERARQVRVTDRDGVQGTLISPQDAYEASDTVSVSLKSGEEVALPAELLERRADGDYQVPVSFSRLQAVVPVVEETLKVGTRRVEKRYRITKHVHEYEEMVDEPGFAEEIHIERVPVNRVVDAPVGERHEGETTIIPVYEEVVVVERRLVLKEELHVTRRRREIHQPQAVTLRHEEVTVEEVDPDRDSTEQIG